MLNQETKPLVFKTVYQPCTVCREPVQIKSKYITVVCQDCEAEDKLITWRQLRTEESNQHLKSRQVDENNQPIWEILWLGMEVGEVMIRHNGQEVARRKTSDEAKAYVQLAHQNWRG